MRKVGHNLCAWIYEQLKRDDNKISNFIVYYQLVGILMAEISDRQELAMQLIKVLLAIQVSFCLNQFLRREPNLMREKIFNNADDPCLRKKILYIFWTLF